MAIPYLNLARAVLVRTGQLGDAVSAADLETLYTGSLVNALEGVEIPLSELKRLVIATEKQVADICCRQKNPILKQMFSAESVDIESGDAIPVPDDGSADGEWIGTFDGVYDSDDDQPLTEKPKQSIIQMNRRVDAGELRLIPFHFAMDGKRVYHTRPDGAYLAGYSWSQTERLAAYAANGDSLLHVSTENWCIAKACANAASEGWFTTEAGVYAAITRDCEAEVKEGVIPSAILPDATASSEPVKN